MENVTLKSVDLEPLQIGAACPQYAHVDKLEPGQTVNLLVSTQGRAWSRVSVHMSRLADRDGAPVFVFERWGVDKAERVGDTGVDNPAHRALASYIKDAAGNWAWRIETRRAALLREYAALRRQTVTGVSSIGAGAALNVARNRLERGGESGNPYGPGGLIWSGCKAPQNRVFSTPGESRVLWIENPKAVGLRLVGLAHKAAPAGHSYMRDAVEHSGWYLDESQSETVAGIVYRLPGANGRARYLYGYADPWNTDKDGNGPACLSLDVLEGEAIGAEWESDSVLRDAARRADGMAERMAEETREHESAYQAGARARGVASDALQAAREWTQSIKVLRAVYAARHSISPGNRRASVSAQIANTRRLCGRVTTLRELAQKARDNAPATGNAADGFKSGYAEGV